MMQNTVAQAVTSDKKYILTEKIDETPEVVVVKFKSADGHRLQFDSGMFVMIYGKDKEGKVYQQRAFSIASLPGSEELELLVVKEHGGHQSHFVVSNIGDEFYLKRSPNGALANGQFRFDPKQNTKITLIAGGTGVAPHLSILRYIKEQNLGTDIVLLYSIKFPTEIIHKQELEDMSKNLKLKTIITVTRPQPGDGWTGQTGHIDANMLTKYAPDIKERTSYVCGPLAFVQAVKAALVSLGVPANEIRADIWG